MRTDRVAEKVFKYIGGKEEDTLSIRKFAGYKTEVKRKG